MLSEVMLNKLIELARSGGDTSDVKLAREIITDLVAEKLKG